jgi:uncharacterized protein (TIGR01244 family)
MQEVKQNTRDTVQAALHRLAGSRILLPRFTNDVSPMRSIHGLWLLFTLLLGSPLQAQAGSLSDVELAVADDVVLAGRLHADAESALRARDAVVIDLRTAAEGVVEESHALWRAGIAYINLPTTGTAPAAADVALFSDILAANQAHPVVVHCQTGNRAALMWAAHRLDAGASVEAALAELRGITIKPQIEQAIRDYAASRAGEHAETTPIR